MTTRSSVQTHAIPRQDRVLQNREELIAFCEWIEAHDIRSYLEIGIWTGRLVTLLHELFAFDRVAACDVLAARTWGLPVRLHRDVELFTGSSRSIEYRIWRQGQAPFDLVMIDGDHSYEGVCRDFEIHRSLGDRYLAFHDIRGGDPSTEGVRRFWTALADLQKTEIVEPHAELGIDYSDMGIGIVAMSSPV